MRLLRVLQPLIFGDYAYVGYYDFKSYVILRASTKALPYLYTLRTRTYVLYVPTYFAYPRTLRITPTYYPRVEIARNNDFLGLKD